MPLLFFLMMILKTYFQQELIEVLRSISGYSSLYTPPLPHQGVSKFYYLEIIMRKQVYTPLYNLFFNYQGTFYKRDSLGRVTNWEDILSGDLKNPHNKFKALFDSFYHNFKIINDILYERILENRENLGKDKKAFLKLKVDLINLFIFIRIQMDKIAELTTYFYENEEITGKKRESFNKQRNWWLIEGVMLDKEFAEIVRTKTEWFDELIGEMGLRDGIIHKNMNIHIDTRNYEINGAVIKKTKGQLTVGETKEVLEEVRKHLEGFYDFCRAYEVFFLKKIKKKLKFEEKEYWYDSEGITRLLNDEKRGRIIKPLDYEFMRE